jgi:hypothetical protein
VTVPEPASEASSSGPVSGLGRHRPSTVGGIAYLVVCAVAACGLAVVALGPWRRGVMMLGAALLFAGGMRLVLSQHDAGMLRVRRNRFVDATMLLGVGSALIALARVIPDQPG